MEKLKNKYEIILGFVTLVISLSAFKDELKQIHIDVGYTNFTLADYFLFIVIGFSMCLYLYVVESVLRDTKIGNWKIFDYIIRVAYFLFIFTLVTPFIIILNIGGLKLYTFLNVPSNTVNLVTIVFNIILFVMSEFLVRILVATFKERRQENIEIEKIKELDNATKLFSDGYYSQSLLESYKAIETYLYKNIVDKGIRVQPGRFNDLIQIATKENIIKPTDLSIISNIRSMRNAAAHTDVNHTKEQAESALNFVHDIFKREAMNN